MNFLGNIEFSKTNAQGRKRYKRKLRHKTSLEKPKASGLLATRDDRDKVKTSIQVIQEGRKWINTGVNLKRVLG